MKNINIHQQTIDSPFNKTILHHTIKIETFKVSIQIIDKLFDS